MKIHANLMLLACLSMSGAIAGSPSSGTVYIGAAFGTHNVYKVMYQYDGVSSMTATTTILATLPSAADSAIVPGGDIVVAGQGANVYKVNYSDGSYATVNSGNNGNVVSLDPSGAKVWIGWTDASPSAVPLNPFANGTVHAVTGDDSVITQLAFTPAGVFYTNGGSGAGNYGHIDLNTFTATRLLASTYATGLHYDAFSRTLILAGLGHAAQYYPANPAVALSSRDDSAAGENYLSLRPDGVGHLFGTRAGGSGGNPTGGRLVLIDYSTTGLIGDATTVIVSAPIVDGLSGGVAVDTAIFADGFQPR
jgi:hypothetical protein